MTGTVLTPPDEKIVLDGVQNEFRTPISWQTYQALLEELSYFGFLL